MYCVSRLNLGGLELCLGPTKASPLATGLYRRRVKIMSSQIKVEHARIMYGKQSCVLENKTSSEKIRPSIILPDKCSKVLYCKFSRTHDCSRRAWHPFVPSAKQLISSSDGNNRSMAVWRDHRLNAEWLDNTTATTCFHPWHRRSPSWNGPARNSVGPAKPQPRRCRIFPLLLTQIPQFFS